MKNSEQISERLNLLLADYQIFYQNLRGFHWNIQGKHFFELHAKFEEQYTDAAEKVDMIAERILSIGGKPLHAFDDYLEHSRIDPKKNIHDGEGSVKGIVADLSHLLEIEKEIKETAADSSDDGTEDLMSDFIDEHEKTLWMFNAWLK